MGKSFNSGYLTNIIGYSGSNVAITGSVNVSGSMNILSNLVVTGSITAQQYIVSSSVTYLTESFASGSHKFGDSSDDIHQFTGSVYVSGTFTATSGSFYLGDSVIGTYFLGGSGNTARQLKFSTSTATNAGDTHTIDAQSATGQIILSTTSSPRVIVTSAGASITGSLSITGDVTATHTIVATGGNSTNPIIYVVGDTNTGIYFPSTGKISLSNAGTNTVNVTSNLFTITGSLSMSSSLATSSNNNSIYSSTNNNLYIQGGSSGIAMYSDGGRYNASLVMDSTAQSLYFGTAGSTRMTISGSSGFVGINTTTPDRALCIQGSGEAWIRATTTATSTQNWLFGQDGARKGFEVYDASTSTTRFFISPSSGNVGINKASSNATLDVNGSTIVSGSITSTSTITSQVNGSTFGTAGSTGRAVVIQGGSANQVIQFKNAAGGDATLYVEGTSTAAHYRFDTYSTSNALFIANGGGIGVGTNNPSGNLHINANSGLLTKDILIVQGGGSPSGNYGFSCLANNGDKLFYTDHLTYHVYTNTAGGRFLVGTTSSSIPNNKMYVALGGTESFKAGSWETYTYQSNNGWIGENVYFDGNFKYRTTGYANAFYSDGGSGAEIRVTQSGAADQVITWKNGLTCAPNGNVYNYSNTTTWQQTSDIRIKENVNSLNNGLDVLLTLRPVTFDYKEDFATSVNWEEEKRLNNVGFIAQEFEEIFPKYVGSSERRINGEFETLKNIDTSHLTPYLVKAIQEQQTQIAELKAIIERNNLS